MKPEEYLLAYCMLDSHGFSHEEIKKIIEDVNEKMKKDDE